MDTAWALVPLKSPARAKSRLESLLSRDECAALARHAAADVLGALSGSGCFAGIGVLAGDDSWTDLARRFGARVFHDTAGRTFSQDLSLVACDLAAAGVGTLLVVPGDVPLLNPVAVRHVLRAGRRGVSVCAAERDGGTNALVLSPPDAIGCAFGPDSARRHLEAAEARGVPARRVVCPALARDVDTPEDLRWLCDHAVPGATRDFLLRSGIAARLAAEGALA